MRFRRTAWWQRFKWHEWAMLAALAAWVVVQVFGWGDIVAMLKHDATTAWVQAIGSIAAVGVAVVIMQRQIKHQEHVTRDSDLRKMNMIQSSLFFARMRAIRLITHVEAKGDDPHGLADLAARMRTLSTAPMFEFPAHTAWYAVELLQEEFRSLCDRWEGPHKTQEDARMARLTHLAYFVKKIHSYEVGLEDSAYEEFRTRLGIQVVFLTGGGMMLSGRAGWETAYGEKFKDPLANMDAAFSSDSADELAASQ